MVQIDVGRDARDTPSKLLNSVAVHIRLLFSPAASGTMLSYSPSHRVSWDPFSLSTLTVRSECVDHCHDAVTAVIPDTWFQVRMSVALWIAVDCPTFMCTESLSKARVDAARRYNL
jgi:hypothetical protein